MQRDLPDFAIIGAMKSATTTLHEQLARQPGFAMSSTKEPNFFSDDAEYAKGRAWYASLFKHANEGDLLGESSTHYAKLPVYPKTVERMLRDVPHLKLVYVMRHPVDRLLSHYRHDFHDGKIPVPINQALELHTGLVHFSRYAMQLRPFMEAFGHDRIHPIFFDRLVDQPQSELERLCEFLGHEGRPTWIDDLKAQNVGTERMRRSPLRQALVTHPLLIPIRRALLPRAAVDGLKRWWRIKDDEAPALSEMSLNRLRDVFDQDLALLGSWLGIDIDCENFHEAALTAPANWQGLETHAAHSRMS